MEKLKQYIENIIDIMENNSTISPDMQCQINGMLYAYKNILEIINKYHQ